MSSSDRDTNEASLNTHSNLECLKGPDLKD